MKYKVEWYIEVHHTNNPLINKNIEDPVYSEGFCLALFAMAMIFGGSNAFFIKYLKSLFPDDYDAYSLSFWRAFFLMIISYCFMYFKKIEILDLRKVQNKLWFGMRTIGTFVTFISYIFCLMYLRVGTANSIGSMNPAVVVIFSTFILKEKFHVRYIIGIFICFMGTLLIVNNDKKTAFIIEDGVFNNSVIDSENSERSGSNGNLGFILGCFYGTINLILQALQAISSKVLIQENIGYDNQCFYLGISNAILSIICAFYFNTFNYGVLFILGCFVNAILFYLCLALTIVATKDIDLSKTTPLTFLTTFTVYIFGITLLHEPIYFTDGVGSLIILGYNIFNSCYKKNN